MVALSLLLGCQQPLTFVELGPPPCSSQSAELSWSAEHPAGGTLAQAVDDVVGTHGFWASETDTPFGSLELGVERSDEPPVQITWSGQGLLGEGCPDTELRLPLLAQVHFPGSEDAPFSAWLDQLGVLHSEGRVEDNDLEELLVELPSEHAAYYHGPSFFFDWPVAQEQAQAELWISRGDTFVDRYAFTFTLSSGGRQ